MARTPDELQPNDLAFLSERHLATLTTLRGDGTPHVVAIAFTYDSETGRARMIASERTQKVVNAERGDRAVVCQVEGRRWLSLEGTVAVHRDAASVTDAEDRYAVRYRPPRENPERVVVEITVDRILGRA